MRIPYASAIVPSLLAAATLLAGCTETQTDPDVTEGIFPGAKAGTLYFGANSDQGIYAYDIDDRRITRLVSGYDPTIATDGALVCGHPAGLVEYLPGDEIYRPIVSRSHAAPVDQTYDDEFHDPQVSRDGKYIAYQGDAYDVYVVDRSSGALLATITGEGYSHPSWTTDNRLVLAGNEAKSGLYITDDTWTTIMPLGGALPTAMTPAVSPDGSTILFAYQGQLYTIGIDGMNLELSSEFPGINPSWAPEGTYYAFSIGDYNPFSASNACLYNPNHKIMIEPFSESDQIERFSDLNAQVALY